MNFLLHVIQYRVAIFYQTVKVPQENNVREGVPQWSYRGCMAAEILSFKQARQWSEAFLATFLHCTRDKSQVGYGRSPHPPP